MSAVKSVTKVDDLTVDIETKFPDPIFLEEITNWVMMSKAWCTEHKTTQAADLTSGGRELRHAARKRHRAIHPEAARA